MAPITNLTECNWGPIMPQNWLNESLGSRSFYSELRDRVHLTRSVVSGHKNYFLDVGFYGKSGGHTELGFVVQKRFWRHLS